MISHYKIEPSYVTIRKHRGAPAPGAPMVPTPMQRLLSFRTNIEDYIVIDPYTLTLLIA